jgi:LysM repeat protein
MKKNLASPLLVLGLGAVLILAAGCDRPDTQAPLEVPQDIGAPTATLAPNEMPPGFDQTVAAGSGEIPTAVPAAGDTPTPLPPQQPQATDTPLPPAATSAPSQGQQPTAAPVTVPTGGTVHTVQSGERLFSIGRLYNVSPYAIAQANNILPPYVIYPGQKLTIPGSSGATPVPGGQTYVVQPGDNLFRISLRFNTSMQAIAAANNLGNISLIFVGQVLKIP